MVSVKNFHRSAQGPSAARGHAGRIIRRYDIAGHALNSRLCRVLAVKGRKSGEWRTTAVNPLTHEGCRYLVAPRGETQWVRNLRAVGTGELRVGKRAESFRGRELSDDEKVPVRAYLKGGRRR